MADADAGSRHETLRTRLEQPERLDGVMLARRLHPYPFFAEVQGMAGPEIAIAGGTAINLGSNNYLGLASDPRVIEASVDAVRRWGAGVTGSRLLNGNLTLHEQFEAELAKFFGF